MPTGSHRSNHLLISWISSPAFSCRLGSFPDHCRVTFRLVDGCLHLASQLSHAVAHVGFTRESWSFTTKNQCLNILNYRTIGSSPLK